MKINVINNQKYNLNKWQNKLFSVNIGITELHTDTDINKNNKYILI